MKFHSSRLISLLARAAAIVALSSFLLVQSIPNAVQAGRADLSGPAGSGKFGANVYALPNGNFVVTDPEFSPTGQSKIGAVYLYDGTTHEQISRMTGVTDNDMVGSGGVRILNDGSFVVASPRWNNGAASMAGAVTACSATTGCPSTVTSGNSLVGSHTNDYVGANSTPDPHYFNDYNSIRPVSGSAYLVSSVFWDGNKGAVTYCSSGSSPNCLGAVSSSNSLVGSTSGDYIGLSYVTLVPSGGYIVNSSYWTNGGLGSAGAVIPCPAAGCTGVVSTTNSLYGDAAGGQIGMSVTLLTGGGFAVQSYNWGNGLGAVTFCASLTDTRCVGKPISAANSLLGKPTVPNTMVGSGGITALPDGGYLVKSPSWRNDALVRTGALTYCSVSGGASTCTGQNVTDTNSLTGTQDQDNVGSGVTLLPNGAFLVHNAQWHNWTGALTYCGSAAACMGQDVSSANSLVGGNSGPSWSDPTGGDMVSGGGVLVLSSGEYVVFSPKWDSAGTNDEKGAATFCPATGCTGLVTLASSLSGSKANDMVGMGGGIQLSGGALIISSPNWANGAHPNAGAVTYCSTPAACKGTTVEVSNSLVSDQDNTQIGYFTYISLSTGGYLVASPNWANGAATFAGAITWCPAAGCRGMTISASNSLVGSHTNDYLGYSMEDVGDNLYVALNDGWQNDTLPGAGSVTLCTQSAGCSGPITASNSVLGSVAGLYGDAWGYNSAFNTYSYDTYNHQLLVGLPLENKVVFFALSQAPGATTAAASSITSTGATLNGTVNAYNASTTVTFEYGLTTAYGSTATATQSPVTGSASTPVSKAISGLAPNTTYHFRVVANSIGGTTYGADLTFTTSTLVITISGNAGTGGVTLSYTDGGLQTAVADDSGNYSFSVPYNWSGMVTPSKTGYTFIPDSQLYTNLVTNPPAQNYLAVYTPPQVQPASAIKAGQFTANWSACPGAVTYYLDVATDDNFTAFVPGYQNLDVGSVTALTLTGLSPHTTYYYRVRASDGSLISANSSTAQAFTQSMFFLPVIHR